jgi:hypothetical protein
MVIWENVNGQTYLFKPDIRYWVLPVKSRAKWSDYGDVWNYEKYDTKVLGPSILVQWSEE